MPLKVTTKTWDDLPVPHKKLRYPELVDREAPQLFGIMAFVGSRGSGKSYALCEVIHMYLEHGNKDRICTASQQLLVGTLSMADLCRRQCWGSGAVQASFVCHHPCIAEFQCHTLSCCTEDWVCFDCWETLRSGPKQGATNSCCVTAP